jgi:4-hydroxy-tetrahydrodipicolinate reductase
MIRVGVVGAAGRMGREVCRAVEVADDLMLAAAIDPAFGKRPPQEKDGPSATVVSAEIEGLEEAAVDVAVDFSVATATRRVLPWLADRGIHAVVGTTGLTTDDLAMAAGAFSHARANAVIAPNFAIGAVLLMRCCELAAPFMDGAEIIEMHHDAKRDAPSGTAMQTAVRIADARARAGLEVLGDRTTEVVLEDVRGGGGPGGIRVHSVRLTGLVAHQEVIFGATGQTFTMRHDSYDRRSFMPGVLLAVRRVADVAGLTIGLDALLGI